MPMHSLENCMHIHVHENISEPQLPRLQTDVEQSLTN